MALTTTMLSVHLRLSGDPATPPDGALLVVLTRVLATASAMVSAYAGDAPEPIKDEAVVRLSGWLYDSDPAGSTPGGPAAMRSSGAASLLSPYRVRRAGLVA